MHADRPWSSQCVEYGVQPRVAHLQLGVGGRVLRQFAHAPVGERRPAHLGPKQAMAILLNLCMTSRTRSSEVCTSRAMTGTGLPPAEDSTTRARR
jgi:hypothetical protein